MIMKKNLTVFLLLAMISMAWNSNVLAQCGVGSAYLSRNLPSVPNFAVAGPCDYAGEHTPWTETATAPQTYNVVVCNSGGTANPSLTNGPYVEVYDNTNALIASGPADCLGNGVNFTTAAGTGPYRIATWDGVTCGTLNTCTYAYVECVSCATVACNVDYTLNGAGNISGTTAGAGDNCILKVGEDIQVQVEIPTAGAWTFSLCGSTFDTYLYLTDDCCGGTTLASDDDEPTCSPSTLASLIAYNIATPGTYYLTIEPFSSTGSGDFVLTVTGPPPAVANDNCLTSEFLSQNTSYVGTPGTIAGSSDSGIAACSGTADDDVWYSFVAATTDPIVQTTTVFDGVLELFSGSCGGLVSIGCADNAFTNGTEFITTEGLTIGQTYYVRVHSWSSALQANGSFEIGVYNNVCTVDESITAPGTWTGTTVGAGNGCILYSSEDYIYEVTIPTAGDWTFSLCGSGYDTRIVIGSDCCTEDLGMNDDACGLQSEVVLTDLTAGTYYVMVEGFATASAGDYTLTISNFVPAENDECSGAIAVQQTVEECGSPVSGSVENATDSFAPSTCDGYTAVAAKDVWFSFVATTDNPTIELTAPFDAVVDLWSGTCGGGDFASVTCADLVEAIAATGLTVGETYYVRVYNYSTFTPTDPTFTLCVYNSPNPPANDECLNAEVISQSSACNPTNGTVAGSTQTNAPIACDGLTAITANDVWYSFVATSTDPWVIVDPAFAAQVEILAGTCGGASIACGNNYTGVVTIENAGLTIGQTYYVRIWHYYNFLPVDPSFTICVQDAPSAPANDECTGAISVTQNATCVATLGSVLASTQSQAAVTCSGFTGTADDDIWFSFVATTNNPVIDANMAFDGVSELFSGSCGSLVSIGCADANFSTGVESIEASGLTVGQTYYVRLYSYSSIAPADPSVAICVRDFPPPPANDNCSGATVLTHTEICEPTTGTVEMATNSAPAISCEGFTGSADDDVWYSFVAGAADTTFIDVNANFDSVVELLSGACGSGATLDCADANFSFGLEQIQYIGLVEGQTYYVRVYSYSSVPPTNATFNICVYGVDPVDTSTELNCGLTLDIVNTGEIAGTGYWANFNVYEINISGAGMPIELDWNNEGYVRYDVDYTTNIITVYTAANATFAVTITDDNDCTEVVTNDNNAENDIMAIVEYTITDDDGSMNGAINITVSGGTSSYSYEWSNGATTQDVNGLEGGWYSVTVTDNGTGQEEVGWYWVATERRGRGKEDLTAAMQIAPNPTANNTNISFAVSNSDWATVEIFDMTGKNIGNVFTGAIQANRIVNIPITTNGFPAGMYIVTLKTNNGVVKQEKLVIAK
jgi:hypothetical protein